MNRNSLHRVANTRAKATNDTLILHYTIQCTKFSETTLTFIREIQDSTEYRQFEKRGLWKMGDMYSFTPYGTLNATDKGALPALEQDVIDTRNALKTDLNDAAKKQAVNDAIQKVREKTPTFIGMIKTGTSVANDNALSLKVIVRGVVSVPIWWFTKTDFTTRNHQYMGPFFRHNQSQGKKAKSGSMTTPMTDGDWLKIINRPSGSRAPMDGIECFFKM